MPEISFRSLAEQCAPTPEDVELYRHIWNYHVWGYSIDMIADTLQNVGFSTNRTAVQRALKEMKSRMEGASYRELAEGEVREYLALNAVAQQELMDLFVEARNDFLHLRKGQVRRADGSKVMQVTAKDLMGMLQGVERLAQNRAAVLTKLSEGQTSGSTTPRLTAAQTEDDLVRKPDVEDVEYEIL
jgi:hypothetical protein